MVVDYYDWALLMSWAPNANAVRTVLPVDIERIERLPEPCAKRAFIPPARLVRNVEAGVLEFADYASACNAVDAWHRTGKAPDAKIICMVVDDNGQR